MRETFEEYKSTIENNIIKFTYLYDGDVISSIKRSYSINIKHGSVSPNVIIDCIIDIYNRSVKGMIDRSIEVITPLRPKPLLNSSDNNNIFYYIDKLKENNGFKPLYVFCSENGRKMFGITKDIKESKPFPGYLYDIERYHNKDYDLYLSPMINDNIDEVEVYVTNRSIQSLVYSIQNMDYIIDKFGDEYKHIIRYNYYDCDFICYKLLIKDISRLREYKINQILNDY
jgi:hypothetical protein